jgi:hypothetical protein
MRFFDRLRMSDRNNVFPFGKNSRPLPPLEKGDKGGFKSLSIFFYEREKFHSSTSSE